ncbi:hypothetical protein HPB50_016586 [Hyalomma asiaticum]|uniref:Uncharacterized protein n=1 Tax=Hyalomma asiaticum TaxID=266040 RepID=A0ACB7S7F4_HYAAI|nr:hypothetical protein HPB50_016586 [Hyalomma asiaticum]
MDSNREQGHACESSVSNEELQAPVLQEVEHSDGENDQPEGQKCESGAAGDPVSSPSTSADTWAPVGTHKSEATGTVKSYGRDPNDSKGAVKKYKIPEFRHRPNCNCGQDRKSQPELGSGDEMTGSPMSSCSGAQTTSSDSTIYYYETLEAAKTYGKSVRKAVQFEDRRPCKIIRDSTIVPFTASEIVESKRKSAAERMRGVEATLAEAREVLCEFLYGILNGGQGSSNTSSLDIVVLDDELPREPSPESTSPRGAKSKAACFQLTGGLRWAVDPVLDSISELEEESRDPRSRVRYYVIGDELFKLYERIEARLRETCDQVWEDMNCRYTQFVTDCRDYLQEVEVDEFERNQWRGEMAEARRRLISLLEAEFSKAIDTFNDWRASFIQHELQLSYMSLAEGDPYSLLASLLRCEILECLPKLEKYTEERASELWKTVLEQHWRDDDGIFE